MRERDIDVKVGRITSRALIYECIRWVGVQERILAAYVEPFDGFYFVQR